MASPALVAEKPSRHEVADVLRDHAHGLRLSGPQARAVRDIVACRTDRLGGHLEVCPDCGFSRGSYNSCRNRHCPKCQILKQELWAEAQEALLLPTSYFQIVFTIPRQLHRVLPPGTRGVPDPPLRGRLRDPHRGRPHQAQGQHRIHRRPAHLEPAASIPSAPPLRRPRRRARPRRLAVDPHLAGDSSSPSKPPASSFAGSSSPRSSGPFARGKSTAISRSGPRPCSRRTPKVWNVYAKRPLAGPGHVVRYLSRYVHRIAIANSRITDYDGVSVTFRYKDRADGNATKHRTLSGQEFARLFLQHVLPPRFVRIRHYGILAARRREDLARCRELLDAQPMAPPEKDTSWVVAFERLFGSNPLRCPACKTGVLVATRVLPPMRR